MNLRPYRLMVPLAVLAVAGGCGSPNTSPAAPSAAAVAPAAADAVSEKSTPSIAAPRPQQPPNGALIGFQDQPVTLVARNALVTKAGVTTTYTVEVATDAAFGTKVQTKANVAEGS